MCFVYDVSFNKPKRIKRKLATVRATTFTANLKTSSSVNVPKPLVACECDLGKPQTLGCNRHQYLL
jgi:hypothetical protein